MTTTQTTTETPSVIPINAALSSVTTPALKIILTPTQQARVREIVGQKTVVGMAPNEIALFGSERQVAFSQSLDGLLVHITKGSSPVLFQLFKELQTGADKVDIGKLETDIKKSINTTWVQKLTDMIPFSGGVAGRIQRTSKRIGDALTTKTASLLDLMKKMEGQVNTELQRLIADSQKLDILAREFVTNGQEYGVTVEAGRLLLNDAKNTLTTMKNNTSGDMMKIQEAKDFERKVQLFESRNVILETAYIQSFSSLEMVGMAKGASITTIAETANAVLSEFTSIKESLVQLSVSYQIQSVQALGEQRRLLRDVLQTKSSDLLGNVAVTAAKAVGDNRLADAQKLSTFVASLKQIGTNVETEHKNNTQKFAEARTKLVEVQSVLTEITKN